MATRATGPLSTQLQKQGGFSPEAFCSVFEAWKKGFPDTEYTDFSFGKDGAYAAPTVDGKKYVLRHVHLAPVSDHEALAEWKNAFFRGKRSGKGSKRTSNRALIYVSRPLPLGGEDHLLIFILTEPDAHEIARMRTPENRQLMEQFAEVAAAFVQDGSVIF